MRNTCQKRWSLPCRCCFDQLDPLGLAKRYLTCIEPNRCNRNGLKQDSAALMNVPASRPLITLRKVGQKHFTVSTSMTADAPPFNWYSQTLPITAPFTTVPMKLRVVALHVLTTHDGTSIYVKSEFTLLFWGCHVANIVNQTLTCLTGELAAANLRTQKSEWIRMHRFVTVFWYLRVNCTQLRAGINLPCQIRRNSAPECLWVKASKSNSWNRHRHTHRVIDRSDTLCHG